MRFDEIDRTKLLPRSGVGVVAPWLVIMPPGNPTICIDLRMLDGVRALTAEDLEENDAKDESNDEEKIDADEWSEWRDPTCQVVLVVGELEVSLFVADGPEAAADIVQQAAAVQRAATGSPGPLVLVNDQAVTRRGDYLVVGQLAFRISEVREYALLGANIPLGEGRLLQAAMAMMVVAASERDEARESSADERND